MMEEESCNTTIKPPNTIFNEVKYAIRFDRLLRPCSVRSLNQLRCSTNINKTYMLHNECNQVVHAKLFEIVIIVPTTSRFLFDDAIKS